MQSYLQLTDYLMTVWFGNIERKRKTYIMWHQDKQLQQSSSIMRENDVHITNWFKVLWLNQFVQWWNKSDD